MEALLCMIGLHRYKDWVQYQTVKIVSGYNDEYTQGYTYYSKATCTCCGFVKHKRQTIR